MLSGDAEDSEQRGPGKGKFRACLSGWGLSQMLGATTVMTLILPGTA